MKTFLVTMAAIFWACAIRTQAQSVIPIYSFTNGLPENPYGGLTLGPDGNFYGTTYEGGSSAYGAIFKINTNGDWNIAASFNGTNNGYSPYDGLTLGPDGNFYGTTYGGPGVFDTGTIFKFSTNGSLTTLAVFNNDNGASPYAGLTLGPDGNFYGTTYEGGSGANGITTVGYGTLFKFSTNGGLTTLVNFNSTNGANPYASLTLGLDGKLYGSTYAGGANGDGTVFKVSTNGGFTTLVNFNGTNGYSPYGSLALGSDGSFYGTTVGGGSGGGGTVFKVTTNGGLTTLASFNGTNGSSPYAGLTLGLDGNFYGTTQRGSNNNFNGTVFKMTTNGSLTTLINFNSTNNGGLPYASMTLGADGNLYGTTAYGGASGVGTVFKLGTNGGFATLTSFLRIPSGDNPYGNLAVGPDGNFYGTSPGGGSGRRGTVFKIGTNGGLTVLVNFNSTNGANPESCLMLGPNGNFYGTTRNGGGNNYGTVFEMSTNGSLATLASFNSTNGAYPYAGLTLGSDGNFYGTTCYGGSSNEGTIFQMNPSGTLITLVNFNSTNGANPYAGLTLGVDGNFYGTTFGGGSSGAGTVFKMSTNGSLTTLASFRGANGGLPYASLALGPDGNFYGTTYGGATYGSGTVFKVSTNGSLNTLHTFSSNGDGLPFAGLTLAPDGSLYGTTSEGGSNQAGYIFKINTNGYFSSVISFTSASGNSPTAGLTLGPDGNFYGSAEGGSGGNGTIYRLQLPPDFITGPANQSAVLGGSATFNCQAFGSAPFCYQWLSNGIPIAGALGSSLNVANLSYQSTNVQFQVVITNAWGRITSSVAMVSIPPVVFSSPVISYSSASRMIQFSLTGSARSNAVIWTSPDLIHWTPMFTNPFTGGALQFTDTVSTNLFRYFYRAQLQ